MFVANKKEYFISYRQCNIGVALGAGASGQFDGVGFMAIGFSSAPGWIFALYPTYYAPRDSVCTLSNGALIKYAGFSAVVIHTSSHLKLSHSSGRHFDVPLHPRGSIDYLKFNIHHLKPSALRRLQYKALCLQPAPVQHKSINGTPLHSLILHISRGHRSISILQQMIDKGEITGPGYPCKLAPLPGRCPICDAAKVTRIPRGRPRDTTELPVGIRFHLDFTFFNKESIRGFTSCLIIVEATSRYLWCFPCRHKRPPLDIALFFFGRLQRCGIPCSQLRCDEDGALVGSTEFCEIMYKVLGMVMESTGGHASSLNGTVETPNKTLKRMIRSNLMGADMADEFWCFAGQYSALQHVNTLNRRTNKTPAKVWLGKNINESKLQPFGCRAKIISTTDAGRALNPRTSGDPRLPQPNPHHQVITPATAAATVAPGVEFDCRFVGYSNDPAVVLLFQPGSKSHKIRRAHHVILDPYGLSTNPRRKLLPNEHLLRAVHGNIFLPAGVPRRAWHVTITPLDLDTIASPFDPQKCESIKVTLPPQGRSIGLTFTTDEDYMLPVLHRVHPDYDIFDEIPERHNFSRSWVIAIENHKPLTSTGTIEELRHLQLPDQHRVITIQFCPITHAERFTDYEGFRAVFDSMIGLRFAHIAHLPEPPGTPRTFWECLESKHRDLWIQATDAQYHKNQRINLCSAPEPIENVPPDRKVLPVVLAPKIKVRGDKLYEFVTRMCANGSSQEQGVDFEHSWSPTISAIALRLTLFLAAYLGLQLAILDIVNCFQHTLLEEKDCLIIHAPYGYLRWFRHNFPKHKITPSPSGKYVLQIMGKGIQGDKGVGRRWYLLLRKILIDFGFHQCLPEPALFFYSSGSRQHIVNISTDDLLCAFSHDDLFTNLRDHLSRMFDLTTKTGAKLEYLNFRIIQSPHGISFDQSEHILKTIIHKFFPPSTTERLKSVHTPFRTDSAYEVELLEDLPATPSQLESLIKRYRGTYPEILGQLMHVYVWSRLELGFALTRLGRHTQGPSAAAFAGLYRVIRFLATHPHRPIIYPRRLIDGYHTLRVNFDPPKFVAMDLPNSLVCMVDSDHARDHETRRSIESVLLLFGGCAFDWKQVQSRLVALHSTDSETRGAFTASKRSIHAQDIASFLGFPPASTHPVPLYIDSQPCIDILNANAVTSRVKHIAVPIHFIHQLIYQDRICVRKIDTHLNLADSGTKPNPAPTLFRHIDHAIGVRFYPPSDSDHFRLLELQNFVQSPFAKTSKPSTSSSD